MEKKPDRANYLESLKDQAIYSFLMKTAISQQLLPIYLTRKQRLRTEGPAFVILVDGLLKQYHLRAPDDNTSRFIQFILPGTTWQHDREQLSTRIKAVEPSRLLYLPLDTLKLLLKNKGPFGIPGYDPMDTMYFCGLHLSAYLHELDCSEDKLRFLRDSYGDKMLYLSPRSLSCYAGITEQEARYFLNSFRK